MKGIVLARSSGKPLELLKHFEQFALNSKYYPYLCVLR